MIPIGRCNGQETCRVAVGYDGDGELGGDPCQLVVKRTQILWRCNGQLQPVITFTEGTDSPSCQGLTNKFANLSCPPR